MASFQFQPPHSPEAPAPRASDRTSQQAAAASAALVRQRALPRAADAILTAVARAWLEALPMRPRPERLCARYPRVANRLALCWAELDLTERLFDDLLNDRRGGRRGFPAQVLAELHALREVHSVRRPLEPEAPVWSGELENR